MLIDNVFHLLLIELYAWSIFEINLVVCVDYEYQSLKILISMALILPIFFRIFDKPTLAQETEKLQ